MVLSIYNCIYYLLNALSDFDAGLDWSSLPSNPGRLPASLLLPLDHSAI